MENLTNINLETLATTVSAKLLTIHADLAELAEITTTIAQASETLYRDHNRDSSIPFDMISGDYWLSSKMAESVKTIREKIINTSHWGGGAIEDIADKVEERKQGYARAEREIVRKAEDEARHVLEEAVEAADRIPSDFLKISSHTETEGRGKNKQTTAVVVFLFNGNVYEAESRFDAATREFVGYDFNNGRQGYLVRDRRTAKAGPLFKGELTPEEIGKTAHALDSIRAALREHVGPVVAAVTPPSEEQAAIEEIAA